MFHFYSLFSLCLSALRMTCLLTSSFVLLRIEKLLNTNVDIVMNQINLEMQGAISCGGKPVMEFRDVEAVLAAHPQLSQVGFGWLLLSVSSLFTHYSSLATSLVLPIQSISPCLYRIRSINRLLFSVFVQVIPEQDEIGSTKLGKCAVVGNSGSLLHSGHGEEIDAHDAVIRFNGAPTKNYEADVGAKTTVRIQNVDNLGFHEHDDKYLIFTARNVSLSFFLQEPTTKIGWYAF